MSECNFDSAARCWRSLRAALVFFAFIAVGVGAAAPVNAASSESSPGKFISNTAIFPAKNEAEKVVLGVIRNQLEAGYNQSDTALIEAALASDFESRLMVSPRSMLVDSRNGFLDVLKKRRGTGGSERKLLYEVKGIKVNEKNRSATVLAITTHLSNNFNPRFLATLIFSEEEGNWKLRTQASMQLYPAKPELHKVDIIVTESFWRKSFFTIDPYLAHFAEVVAKSGPDAAIESLRKNVKSLSGADGHAIAVFREPPRVGTKISFVISFSAGGEDYQYKTQQSVNRPSSFFIAETILEGNTLAGSLAGVDVQAGSISIKAVEVLVDGVKVAAKKVGN